jgi:hypothetical protein
MISCSIGCKLLAPRLMLGAAPSPMSSCGRPYPLKHGVIAGNPTSLFGSIYAKNCITIRIAVTAATLNR